MLTGGAAQEINNKGKHLMIFNDKSGSMSGAPFTALKEACVGIADDIFDNNTFEKVHTIFYGSECYPLVTSDKETFVNNI